MNSAVTPVVVVGAGPTGITAATLLAAYGVPSIVLERHAGVYAQPRAVHLDDEVCRVLGALGLAGEFATISRPGLGLRLVDRHHVVMAQFERGAGAGAHGYPQANMFDQPELERLLRANLKQHPDVELRGNTEVTGLETGAPDRVLVHTEDRTTGLRTTLRAAFVLGCDGANSVVRDRLGIGVRDLGFRQRWLVVDVDTDAELAQWEGVHQVCDHERAATYMRVGATRYRWEFQLRDGERLADFRSPDVIGELIRPWTTAIPAGALSVRRVAEYTFRAQVARSWRQGRTFLLGDAAHLTPPFIGQGLGAGLRDAANLAWKLAAVQSGHPAALLDSYEAERRPHAVSLIRLARLVGMVMTEGGELADRLRHGVLPRATHLPGLRAKVLDSRTPALRTGPRSPFTLTGRLCPNADTGDGRRFDEVAGPGFALVAAHPPSAAGAGLLRAKGCTVVAAAPGSPLRAWLGRTGAALVRPDRTVQRTATTADHLVPSVPTFVVGPGRVRRGPAGPPGAW